MKMLILGEIVEAKVCWVAAYGVVVYLCTYRTRKPSIFIQFGLSMQFLGTTSKGE